MIEAAKNCRCCEAAWIRETKGESNYSVTAGFHWIHARDIARWGSWVARGPPLFVSHALSKQPTTGGKYDMKIRWETSFWHHETPPIQAIKNKYNNLLFSQESEEWYMTGLYTGLLRFRSYLCYSRNISPKVIELCMETPYVGFINEVIMYVYFPNLWVIKIFHSSFTN